MVPFSYAQVPLLLPCGIWQSLLQHGLSPKHTVPGGSQAHVPVAVLHERLQHSRSEEQFALPVVHAQTLRPGFKQYPQQQSESLRHSLLMQLLQVPPSQIAPPGQVLLVLQQSPVQTHWLFWHVSPAVHPLSAQHSAVQTHAPFRHPSPGFGQSVSEQQRDSTMHRLPHFFVPFRHFFLFFFFFFFFASEADQPSAAVTAAATPPRRERRDSATARNASSNCRPSIADLLLPRTSEVPWGTRPQEPCVTHAQLLASFWEVK